ncbi:FIG00657500: hypothetical protein [hydrothermal vent metagenome]|uniref:DUF4381 domain-containing protein n=1 Tax=hydrothermal vent metagenome TaxID=652676 RepID=A0A3B0YRC8_9ZZZZ
MSGASLSDLGLRDIHTAPLPDFWPPAPGWWLLALLVLVLALWAVARLLSIWRRQRLKQRILGELDKLAVVASADLATQVSTLLRRIALMYFQRSEVAPLTGSAWLAFLDKTGGDGAFASGPGSILASAPYAAHTSNPDDCAALLSLARGWICHNFEKHA